MFILFRLVDRFVSEVFVRSVVLNFLLLIQRKMWLGAAKVLGGLIDDDPCIKERLVEERKNFMRTCKSGSASARLWLGFGSASARLYLRCEVEELDEELDEDR